MSLLDNLLNRFFENKGFTQFVEPVQVEGRTANGRTARSGNTFVLKQDPNTGKNVRLERPEDSVTRFGEQVGLLPQIMKETQPSSFGDFIPKTNKTFNILKSLGQITGLNGSPLWKEGLDIDLRMGDPVPSPVSGTVNYVGARGGFGNQVRVQGDDGREYWLSHLQAPKVTQGQRINAGDLIGLGGNSGNVIPGGPGMDGSHLDLTVREGGQYIPARKVADLLKTYG